MGKDNKLVRIPVITPKGEVKLTFERIDVSEAEGKIMCTSRCPYKDICDKIPDPREPENKELSFIDFCAGLSDSDEDDYLNCLPAKGTIEKELKDVLPDTYQAIIKSESLVPVNQVIDSICPGWCDLYKEDHSDLKFID